MSGDKNKPKLSLYSEVYNQLKQDILEGKYPPGSMLPTELELTETFYVSRITVQKAMQMLRKEGYISRIAGRGTFVERIPTQAKQRTIGLALCNVGASFGLRILTAVERTAAQHGYHVIFKNSLDDSETETKAIQDLVALGVDGLLIQPIHEEYYNKALIQYHFDKFPIVLVDRNFPGFSIPGVSTNNFDAAVTATEHLFQHGHEHIAFISSPQSKTSTVEDRVNGFTSAHFMANRQVTEANFLDGVLSPHRGNDPDVQTQDVQLIKEYLSNNPQITALIASEFTVAKLLFRALRELHKKVPEDYSVIMFDENDAVAGPDVTHVQQDQDEIGRIATETLLAKINQKIVSNKIYVPFRIVAGDTVRRIAEPLSLQRPQSYPPHIEHK